MEEAHSGRSGNQWADPGGQDLIDGVLSSPAEAEAGQGHTHLSGGQQAAWSRQQAQSRLGSGMPVCRHLPQARLAYSDERDFRRSKEPVHHNEKNHQEQAKR